MYGGNRSGFVDKTSTFFARPASQLEKRSYASGRNGREHMSDAISVASEVGIAIFTAVVAILEVARYFQGPKISFLIGEDRQEM